MDACVKTAFERKQQFRARYDRQGIDSILARGIVSTGNGVWVFDYDSMGGSEPAQFPGTFAYECQQPRLASEARGLKLVCVNEYELW